MTGEIRNEEEICEYILRSLYKIVQIRVYLVLK